MGQYIEPSKRQISAAARQAHQALRFVVEMYKTATTRGRTVRRSGAVACAPCATGFARGRTIVATDEGVAILGLELPVYILFRLLHRNVHEAVEAREDT